MKCKSLTNQRQHAIKHTILKPYVFAFSMLMLCFCFSYDIYAAQIEKQEATQSMESINASALSGDDLFLFIAHGKYGFMDRNGNVIIKAQYAKAEQFSENYAVVALNDENSPEDLLFGYIKTNGEIALPIIYGNATSFKGGKANIWNENADKPIDDYGIPTSMVDGKILKGFVIDADFKVISSFDYSRIYNDNIYDRVEPTITDGPFYEGLKHWWDKDEKLGFVNETGQWIIPPTYSSALDFSDGLAAVAVNIENSKKIKWGYIDRDNNIVIPFEYIYADSFSDGIAAAQLVDSNETGFIDKSGEWVIEPQFVFNEIGSDIGDCINFERCRNGLIMITRERSDWAQSFVFDHYIDLQGNVIKPKL